MQESLPTQPDQPEVETPQALAFNLEVLDNNEIRDLSRILGAFEVSGLVTTPRGLNGIDTQITRSLEHFGEHSTDRAVALVETILEDPEVSDADLFAVVDLAAGFFASRPDEAFAALLRAAFGHEGNRLIEGETAAQHKLGDLEGSGVLSSAQATALAERRAQR